MTANVARLLLLTCVSSACPACSHQSPGKPDCHHIDGAPADYLVSHSDSVPPYIFGGNQVRVSELRHTPDGIAFIEVTAVGPLRLVWGGSGSDHPGCLTLPPLAADAADRPPGLADVTDGSCPEIHLGAVEAELRKRFGAAAISTGADILRFPDGHERWAEVVYDWHHLAPAISAVADVLGTRRIGAAIAIAVESRGCGVILIDRR